MTQLPQTKKPPLKPKKPTNKTCNTPVDSNYPREPPNKKSRKTSVQQPTHLRPLFFPVSEEISSIRVCLRDGGNYTGPKIGGGAQKNWWLATSLIQTDFRVLGGFSHPYAVGATRQTPPASSSIFFFSFQTPREDDASLLVKKSGGERGGFAFFTHRRC